MKKSRGDEPVGVTIHGNITRKLSVLLPLSQISKKCHFLLLSFLSYKIEEQEGGTGPAQE
jgi:hypothetical protein